MTPCLYCQTPVESSLTKHDQHVHICPCGVRFQVDAKTGEIDSWGFYTTVNQTKFLLLFIRLLGNKPEFSISDPDKEVLRLNILPNITPANAEEKVKLYLLFS